MNINFTVRVIHEFPGLDRVVEMLHHLINLGDSMSAQLDALTAEVERSATVQASVVALVKGLAAEIAANKDDPVALQALADKLAASDNATADAVVANTPATPAPA